MKFLKKTLIIVLVSLFTFSCSNDDSTDTQENKASIIGTWLLTSETENGEVITLEGCDVIIVFTSTQVTNNSAYGDNCEIPDSYVSNYTINGNTISVTEDGETHNSTIVTLNSTTLKIKSTYTDDGETETYTETYTKQ